jgi:DNA primase
LRERRIKAKIKVIIAFSIFHMPDQILQDIKDRLNVADIIAGYIPIKKAGVNFKAVCPFHNEKTASLVISPQKQIWHCFGCGEGGDIFGFVIKYENLEFRDALKLLADKAGVKLPEYRPHDENEVNEQEQLYRINDFAARYYHEILLKDKRGSQALDYLKNRGLTDGTIKQWQIGFAPDDFHALERALVAKKVSLSDALKAGVISKNERDQMYDRFRGRVTFPIFNYFGRIVGFTARILNDDGKSAKYINSPETAIYNKSGVLFGLNFAKEQIRKKDEIIIVEGQMDCISLHQAGFKNAVASSGTAYNQSAVALTNARRLTKNIKLCFDSDEAGQMALRKAGEMLLKAGFLIKVIAIKSAKDPDELVRKSPGLWEKAATEAVWFLDYYINLAQTNSSEDAVTQIHYLSDQVLPLLNYVQDPLEMDHYIHQITTKFPINEQTVRNKLKTSKVDNITKNKLQNTKEKNLPSLLLEKEVLGGLLTDKNFLTEVRSQLGPEDFEYPDIQKAVIAVLDDSSIEDQSPLAKEAQFMVESQLEELDGNQTLLLRELLKAFALLKMNAIKKLQQHLQTEIKMAEIAKNKIKTLELSQKFAQLSAQRMKIETFL